MKAVMMPFSPQPFFPTRIFAQLAQAILSTVAMLTAPYSTASTMHPNHPLYWKVGSAGSAQKRATLPPWKDPTQWKPSVPNTDPMANTPMFGQNQDGSIRPGYKLAIVPDPAHVPDQALGGAAVPAGVKKDKKKKGKGKGNKSKDKGKGKGKDKRKGDTKDGDKGKDGKRQKGDGKIAVPVIAPGATPSLPMQPILNGDLPKTAIPKTEQQQKGAEAQWVRDALCFASAEASLCLSRKGTKRVKFAVRELHRTAPILLPSNDAVKACVIEAVREEALKAEQEMERLKAKALVDAQLQAATDGAPPTQVGLEAAVAVDTGALGETKSEEGVVASDCSHGDSESEDSDDSDDVEMKPVHAVKVPIPTDGKFWVCEIPLTAVENQNATRMISQILSELMDRTATRASYVSSLCIAQSVVFGAVPLQLTKTNYEEESAKLVATSEVGSIAAEPVSVAASSTATIADTADMAVDTKEEAAKSA